MAVYEGRNDDDDEDEVASSLPELIDWLVVSSLTPFPPKQNPPCSQNSFLFLLLLLY